MHAYWDSLWALVFCIRKYIGFRLKMKLPAIVFYGEKANTRYRANQPHSMLAEGPIEGMIML